MVGRSPAKRSTNIVETPDQMTSPALVPLPSTSPASTSAFSDLMTTPSGAFNGRKAKSVDMNRVNALIKRYLSTGQYKTALFWADERLALSRTNGHPPSLVDVAQFVKVLSTVGDYTRLVTYSDKHELYLRHIFFAYYYVHALYEKKSFSEILKLKLTSLKDFADVTDPAEPFMAYMYKMKCFVPDELDARALDAMSDEFKLESALLVLLGKTYLMSQNRQSARLCLQRAISKDPCLEEAMDIMHKYNLLPKHNFAELVKWFPTYECGVPNAFKRFTIMDGPKRSAEESDSASEALDADFSIRTAKALNYYRNGDVHNANKMSTQVLEDAGMFQDCILVHTATLVQLRKSDELFMLAHKLVDTQPDDEVTWYVVGCYYYSIAQLGAAKNFLNKCTVMNSSFAEGWLAFGHVLSAEQEHEQAMNCFLRASRVLEGSFEPLMYVGLEYSYANNTKLAQDFLSDAANNAGDNPLVIHEQGCIFFMRKEWKSAEEHFTKALRLAFGVEEDGVDVVDLLWKPLSVFWEPLVNNLGHAKRKLGKYLDAVKYHQKALVMCPQKASTIGAMAVAFASAGLVDDAVLYFHQALIISPHDQVLKQGLEKALECLEANACLSSFHITDMLPNNTLCGSSIGDDDFDLTEDEKTQQEKSLETLKRYNRNKKRSDVGALRCRNSTHPNRRQGMLTDGHNAEGGDDADIEMSLS